MSSATTYPAPSGHDPQFDIIDGRHRYVGDIFRGAPSELRCDVISADGHALRVIPVKHLRIDPDVQLDFAYSERRARWIATNWDERKVGVLTVTPIGANGSGLTVGEKADIKTGLDRDRRHVSTVESFLEDVKSGQPEAVAVNRIAEATGWEIGKRSGSSPPNRIGQPKPLVRIYGTHGEEMLRRTLQLAGHWLGEPKAYTLDWICACGLLIRDGYDEKFTPKTWERWEQIVPAKELRIAQGLATGRGSSTAKSWGELAYILAGRLRRTGRLPRLPVAKNGTGPTAQPVP